MLWPRLVCVSVITNDIRDNCKILKHQAESLKTKFGSCLPSNVSQDDIIAIPGIRNQEPREIYVKTLATIINARMRMILEQVQYEIQSSGFERQLIAGVVLTGGGSKLKHIKEYSELITGIDTRIGTPDEHLDRDRSTTYEDLSHPMYATGVGLVIYGLLEEESKEREAAAQAVAAAPEPQAAPEPEPEEEPVDKKKSKADKSKRKSLSADARNFSKSITEWLTRNFTEDGLNE